MRSQTQGRQGKRRYMLAVAASVTLSLALLSACGGGDGPALSGPQASAGGVTLTLPAGWVSAETGESGLVVAERQGDLTAVVPQGPRLAVEPGNTDPPDPEALVSAIAGAGGDAAAARLEVVEEPETVRVGPEEGVAIGLREGEGESAVIKRYVIVSADGITVYQFLLEAPEGEWDGSVDTLEAILASVEFEAAGQE